MSDNSQYGVLPMGQGGLTYKAISKQTAYFMELMKQKEEAAISYAKTYGDVKNGIVAQFLNAANSSAENEGSAIKQDAISSAISAGIGVVGMAATVGSAYATRTGELDGKIDDAEAMKGDLDAAPKTHLVLEEGGPEEELGEETQAHKDKIDSWLKGGKKGENFDNYQAKLEKLEGEDRINAEKSNQINKEAIEHAKKPEYREKLSKKLDDHISDLKHQRSELNSKFQNTVQLMNTFRDPLTQGITTPFTFKKAEDTQNAKVQSAESQVLQGVQQKQSAFIDTAQQEASQFLQAADAAASSLGQIVQVHG